MTLRCLFVDFDSFFASVEQHDDPALQGRPVAVVPVMSATTCCIAASKEAKRDYGIKTGTGVGEALERCPDIALRLARPARYVEMHHQFLGVIEDCIHLEKASSIDEVHAWLMGRERQRANAEAIAHLIKHRLVEAGIGPAMTCSIGIGPNRFIAKTASDMAKPDGLTVIEQHELPEALLGLQPRDLCGIGPSMERRLQRAGIQTMAQLCAASRERLRGIWGGVEGEKFWLQLRGHHWPERRGETASVGHSHVLGPELRSYEGMRSVLFKLLAKAAMRMRHEGLRASGMAIRIRFVGDEKRFERDLRFAHLDDTPALLRMLGDQLDGLALDRDRRRWNPARHPPLSVAVSLLGLERGHAGSGELLAGRERAQRMSQLLDQVNGRYGNNALYLGAMQQALSANAAPMRIPFQHVPDTSLERDAGEPEPAAEDTADALYRLRENQFKVMALRTHRERETGGKRAAHRPSGAGGWNAGGSRDSRQTPSETGDLF